MAIEGFLEDGVVAQRKSASTPKGTKTQKSRCLFHAQNAKRIVKVFGFFCKGVN